jgi:hypothetical protein
MGRRMSRAGGRRLFYCDHHPIPLPKGHRFPIEKYTPTRCSARHREPEHFQEAFKT